MRKIIFFVLVFLLFISLADALTGNSQSYSVSMFGNSLSSGDASSNNYESVFLSQSTGTSRNAESSSFTANVGFFTDSSYARTVSINSYSVSPNSAVVGSTISFSINALNANQVWVEITPPNSQEYTLNLINGQSVNHLPIPSIIGTYQVIFYARSSTGAIASAVSSFELTAQNPVNPGTGSSPGGSGGGSTTAVNCNYNWDCTPWGVCSEGLQRRSCVNIGTCRGIESKPAEEASCSESLFDVLLRLDNLFIEKGDSIKFNVYLVEKIGVDKIDVHIKYSVIDSKGFEIFSQIETRAVQGTLSYEKILSDLSLADGDYILRVDILYGNLQRAFSEQRFSSSDEEDSSTITGFSGLTDSTYRRLYYSVFALIISVLLSSGMFIYSLKNRGSSAAETTLLSLIGFDVYTDLGVKLGKVYDIMIKDNVIYGLMVLVDKSVKVEYPKVLIRYNYVQNIKDVVVVSSHVLDSPSTVHA